MTTFPIDSGGYRYRPLKRGLRGFDIYALQTCLLGAGYDLPEWGSDGQFGSETEKAVRAFQKTTGLLSDGIAGVATQRVLVLMLIAGQMKFALPDGLLPGQIESESSFWVGNYTPPYEDQTRDLGLTMLHKAVTDKTCFAAFHGPESIAAMAEKIRRKKDFYYGQPGARTHQRAWELAAGSHNAPAWTDKLARGGTLSATQQKWIDDYISRVTAYVRHWTV